MKIKSVSLQGDTVITGELFLFYTNLGGERGVERGDGVEKEVIRL